MGLFYNPPFPYDYGFSFDGFDTGPLLADPCYLLRAPLREYVVRAPRREYLLRAQRREYRVRGACEQVMAP